MFKLKGPVLGISTSHDAGVAIIENGVVIAAINEERLSRKKQVSGFPFLSLEAIWQISGIKPSQIELVGIVGGSLDSTPLNNDFSFEDGSYSFSQKTAEYLSDYKIGKSFLSNLVLNECYQKIVWLKARANLRLIREYLLKFEVSAPITTVEHHDGHIAAAYFCSGSPDCLVFSNDGFGDGLCAKVGLMTHYGAPIDIISKNIFFNSLGVYYNYVTQHCGFKKAHHAGKTTGLAAFGDPSKTLHIFQSLIDWDIGRGMYVNKGKIFRRSLQQLSEALSKFSKEDAAAGMQAHLEDILTNMVKYYVALTGRSSVALVGGIHANVKANQRIAELPEVKEVFVFPNMGDGGLAIGAAYSAWTTKCRHQTTPRKLKSVYLGPMFSDAEVEELLKESKLSYHRPRDIIDEVARLLHDNKIIATFRGRMEFGPRALGNRSILYNATDKSVNSWLNEKLNRTEFMPFAPVVRRDDFEDYFIGSTEKLEQPLSVMAVTCEVTKRCKDEAPAVVHVDGTARPQVVNPEENRELYKLLTRYKKLSGFSVVVNTSFNLHEEPIVCSPQDAIRAFIQSSIDYLAIGPFIVEQKAT